MISVQPIQLWRYLGFKKNTPPIGLTRLFYLSWEDAFWDLLIKKKVLKGSRILIPEFYCTDVENNILTRDYKIIRYPVSKNLTVPKIQFIKLIKKYNPKIIIIFHTVGIYNNLLKNTDWVKGLDEDIFLIEDGVHRITNPKNIKILKPNHFVIDSLRKVIPLQGSNIFGRAEDLNYSVPSFWQSITYSLSVHLLWIKMILFWNLKLYQKAEANMLAGYDLIGDSLLPARGSKFFDYLFNYINYDKIYAVKKHQVFLYKKYLTSKIKFSDSDAREMRGFPIIVENKNAEKTLLNLANNNLRLRYELLGCPWSNKRKIMYLPLGLYLSDQNIVSISRLVLKSL